MKIFKVTILVLVLVTLLSSIGFAQSVTAPAPTPTPTSATTSDTFKNPAGNVNADPNEVVKTGYTIVKTYVFPFVGLVAFVGIVTACFGFIINSKKSQKLAENMDSIKWIVLGCFGVALSGAIIGIIIGAMNDFQGAAPVQNYFAQIKTLLG